MLKNSFLETRKNRITLRDSETTIRTFVHWVYTRQLDDHTPGILSLRSLVKTWIFADERDVPMLGNMAIDAFRTCAAKCHHEELISLVGEVYGSTLPGSALRALLMYAIVVRVKEDVLAELRYKVINQGEAWPAEALIDLAEGVWFGSITKKRAVLQSQFETMSLCDKYHSHGEGEHC